MSETYADRLKRIAGAVPRRPCVLALVPTLTTSHAAGLASDLAQRLARERAGHTLVFSLEDAPSRLDHEIGVEGGEGLTGVIEGRLPLARAAASGRARGFIYVPAGRSPAAGVDLVRSSAWRSLVESALGRGGTVVVFLPREVLEAARGAADQPTARFDGVVWLGPEPPDVAWLPWRVLGALDLPEGRPSRSAPSASTGPPPGEEAGVTAGAGEPPGGSRHAAAHVSPPLVGGASRRARQERERRRRQLLVTAMVVVFLAALAVAAIALVGPERREAFLPENEPLWSSSDDTLDSPVADTAPASPDTSGT